MKENKKIVTALDIGSSKILAVVAEVYKDGTFRVLAQGRTESQGVLDGNVTSIEEVQPQVKSALVEAFGIAGKIPSNDVCTNISGKSVEGKDSSAEMPLRGRTVTLSDMKNVQSMAQDAVELKEDQRLIKSELLYYMLDNQDEGYVGQNPIDAKSSRISAHMHSAVASAANALARVKVIRRSGMDISRILPEAWASGYAVLTEANFRPTRTASSRCPPTCSAACLDSPVSLAVCCLALWRVPCAHAGGPKLRGPRPAFRRPGREGRAGGIHFRRKQAPRRASPAPVQCVLS